MQHQARKRFSQNFLVDPGIVRRILASIDARPGESLVEIGPGQGAMTQGLLKAAGSLDAVELDRDLIEPLRERCAGLGELRIHSADALAFDFCTLVGPEGGLRVVGNLPYNISTPLLFHLLDQAHCIRDMHFMLQREVVERMAAPPGDKTYGRLSVMLQARCTVRPLFGIGPGAFRPQPKVESAFVRLTPLAAPLYDPRHAAAFAKVVALAFGQRRKTLHNGLKPVLDDAAIRAAEVDPGDRAERLSVADFVRLAVAVRDDPTAPPDL